MRLLPTLLLLISSLEAQLPSVPADPRFRAVGEAGAGPFGAFEPARLTGIGYTDVVFVRDSKAWLIAAPGYFQGAGRLAGSPSTVKAIRTIPGGNGNLDAVAILSDDGVSVWSIDTVTGQGQHTELAGLEGHSLHVGDVGSDSAMEAAVADTYSVTLVDLTTGATEVRNYADRVLDAVLVNYDGAGEDELVVVTENEILVESGSAPVALLHSVALGGTSAAAGARVRRPMGEERFVAAIGASGVPGRILVELDPVTGTLYSTSFQGQTSHGVGVGDATGDGYEELALLQTAGAVDLLFNLGGPPVLLSQQFQYTVFGGISNPLAKTPNAAERVRPALADLDGDGDGEILFGLEAAGAQLQINQNHLLAATALQPQVDVDGFVVGTNLTIPLILPSIPGATDLEVLGWEVRSKAAEGPTELATMVRGSHHVSVPLAASITLPVEANRSGEQANEFEVHEGYVFLVRLTATGPQGTAVYPAATLAYAVPGGAWDALLLLLDGTPRTVTPLPDPPPLPPPNEGPPLPGTG